MHIEHIATRIIDRRDPQPGDVPIDHPYRPRWWLPVIGPTATILAYTFARNTAPTGTVWEIGPLAQRVGLAGNRSRLWSSLDRLDLFGVARFHATDILTIRTQLPPLTERQAARLPAEMVVNYRDGHRDAIPA